ncbi:MAG: methionyl-tRNA formyltransferase [bacterium]
MTKKLRIVFFGSPAAAVPFLSYLIEHEQVVGVVTRPDKPSGRGRKITQTPVAEVAAGAVNLKKPRNLSDLDFGNWLTALKCDLGVVVAYGKIIPEKIISIPKHGCINIHFSLLPQFRGPAPVQHAIMHNCLETGVTSFSLRKEIDTGPIYVQHNVAVDQDDDAESLMNKLIPAGKGVLVETLMQLKNNSLKGISQSGPVSYAPLIKKEDGRINWEDDPRTIIGKIKALIGWPYAFTTLGSGKRLKITQAQARNTHDHERLTQAPGTVTGLVKDQGFIVQCSGAGVLILRVIPEGKKEMSAWDFLQGRKLKAGDRLGSL